MRFGTKDTRLPFRWLMPVVLLGVVLACYWPSLNGDLLWDDPAHVTSPELRDWSGLVKIWTVVGATQEFYPVLHSAFWLQYQLWGDTTLGYHLVNVFLHAGSCVLLALLLRVLWAPRVSAGSPSSSMRARTAPEGAEWFAALLFAVHPVCVESVAWITEQKNTLSLFLMLLAALACMDFLRHRGGRRFGTAMILFFLALAAKPSTVVLPPALLVIAWWRNGRIDRRRDVVPLLPFFALAIAAGLVTVWVETHHVGAYGENFDWSAVERVLLAGRIIWFYLGKLVWPVELIFYYERWDVAAVATGWWPYLLASFAITAALWAIRGRTRGPLATWLLFIGTLFPVLGFFNVYGFTFSQVADHFQYLPCMVFLSAAAGGISILLLRSPVVMQRIGIGAIVAVLAFLGVRSHGLSGLYINDETLFRSVIERNPGSAAAHHLVGLAISRSSGRSDEAIAAFRRAIELDPEFPDPHLGLGIELVKQPESHPEGLFALRRALELRPFYAEAHNALGLELAKQPDRLDEAIGHFEKAIGFRPRLVAAHLNLANALARDPARLPKAVARFEEVLLLQPGYARAHNDFAVVLSRVPGKSQEAIQHFESAIALAPGFAEAHCNYGDLLASMPGRTVDAIAQYELALRFEPDSAKAHYGLANVLATQAGRAGDAITHYERAIHAVPGFAEAHANMANVLSRTPGRAADAIRHYEEALRIDPGLAWVHFNLALLLSQMPGGADDAVSHFRDALRIRPDYVDALNGLAILFAQQGRFDDARAQWERALAINPDYQPARQNLLLLEQMRAQSR